MKYKKYITVTNGLQSDEQAGPEICFFPGANAQESDIGTQGG